MITLVLTAISALFMISLPANAQDKKADPNGTWTWTQPGRNGGPERKMSLVLKVDGDKVTGKLTSPGRDSGTTETEIADGKIKGDTVSFTITREMNGIKFVQKYNGKVADDSLKGKIEFERNGETQSRDWEAKRKVSDTK